MSESTETENANFELFESIYIPINDIENTITYPGPITICKSLVPMIKDLSGSAYSKYLEEKTSDFSCEFNGTRLRCHYMPTTSGPYLIFRKMPNRIMSLAECGFSQDAIKHLTGPRLSSGGIVVISGMPGNGKSTTCSSLISERLKAHSGLCVTIEDPAELPLQGRHGNGFCLQRNIGYEESFSAAMKDSMRAYPAQVNNIMLIGEVRDGETAALALNSAVDGRLIIISIHAGSVVQAIHRLISQAREVISEDLARSLLSSGLRAIIHQNIRKGKMEYTSLFDTINTCSQIRNKNVPLESLNGEIEAQSIRAKLGKQLDLRGAE